MTISIWRYSHLLLAVSSSLLLVLASVTGIILAVEPILEKQQPYRSADVDQITLAETLPVLKKAFPDISELSVDHNRFVVIKATDDDGKNLTAFVDPKTGKILGKPSAQSEFFQTVTTLHRSLFYHEAGRFMMGLTAFLLVLIAISGTVLIIQRQRGVRRFFTRIVKENFAQYYHVTLGRLSLVVILIIALTGTYLSVVRFELLPTKVLSLDVDLDAIRTKPALALAELPVFKSTRLADVQTIAFPFSEDAEDYYTLKLNDREITVNQVTGDVLTESPYPTALVLSQLSLNLHTGRTNTFWALILAIASANILFFIYSGFAITLKRRGKRTQNQHTADESRFIILVGSENGSTYRFAQLVHQQLVQRGEKAWLAELNQYRTFPKAEHLIILTSTYGLGDAPTNAAKFEALLPTVSQPNPLRYSVVGFGSTAYPDFCKFAFDVHNRLEQQPWATPLVDVHTVNDKSLAEFGLWTKAWTQQAGIPIDVAAETLAIDPATLDTLQVTAHSASDANDDTFLIRLKSPSAARVTSGDLLAIYPANDHRERLYSIGILGDEIQLSVRLHEGGLGSGFLHRLTAGETIRARLVGNPHFHFPVNTPAVVMISNGTGIAPFLGMISQNTTQTPCYLYCGFRNQASLGLYQPFLDQQLTAQRLDTLAVALSREGERQYVSDLISRDRTLIGRVLAEGGVLMLCGSLAMQKDVLAILDTICRDRTGQAVSYYQSRNQIRTDCY